MHRQDLIGSWKLVSLVGKSTDQEDYLPYGLNPRGNLLYTEAGDMAVFMSKFNRPPTKIIKKEYLLNQPNELLKSILEEFNAYSGTFTFDTKKQIVTHDIENAYFQEWIGTTQERYCKLASPEILLLTSPKILLEFNQETQWIFEITWKKGFCKISA